MIRIRDQFTSLASSYHNLEDMEVIGTIIYISKDFGTRQLSTIFSGSDAIKEYIELHQVDARETSDEITTGIK